MADEPRGEWLRVDADGSQVVAASGLQDVEVPEGLLDWLMQAPGSDQFLVKRIEWPTMQPGTIGLLVPHTQFYFNVSAFGRSWGSALIALAAALADTEHAEIVIGAAIAGEVCERFKRLTEDEAELVHVIIGKCHGNPYTSPVPERAVMDAYVDAKVSVDDLLQSLEDRGVIRKRRGGAIQLVF